MRLSELEAGQYCTRAEWDTKAPNNQPLIVHRPDENARLVYEHNNSEVSLAARGRQYNDFFLCNADGSASRTGTTNTTADAFLSTGYILTTSTGSTERCVNMNSVEARISHHLEQTPNMRFRIYKLHAVVEPRIQQLADMLRIVDPSESI